MRPTEKMEAIAENTSRKMLEAIAENTSRFNFLGDLLRRHPVEKEHFFDNETMGKDYKGGKGKKDPSIGGSSGSSDGKGKGSSWKGKNSSWKGGNQHSSSGSSTDYCGVMSRLQDDYDQELERKDPEQIQSAVVDGIRYFLGMDSKSKKSSARTNKSEGNEPFTMCAVLLVHYCN